MTELSNNFICQLFSEIGKTKQFVLFVTLHRCHFHIAFLLKILQNGVDGLLSDTSFLTDRFIPCHYKMNIAPEQHLRTIPVPLLTPHRQQYILSRWCNIVVIVPASSLDFASFLSFIKNSTDSDFLLQSKSVLSSSIMKNFYVLMQRCGAYFTQIAYTQAGTYFSLTLRL